MDEKELKQITDQINSRFDQLNDIVAKKADADGMEKKYAELADLIAKLPASAEVKKMQDQLDAMDVKMQTAFLSTKQGQETIPEQLKKALQSDEYKAASKDRGRAFNFEVKSNELTSSQFTETNGLVIAAMYEPGVISAPQRPTPVWNLISKGVATSDPVIHVERSAQTIGASATHVDEAGAFGQSYGGWTTYKFGVHKIAEYIKVAREKLEDWEYVRGEVMDMLLTNIPHIREGKFLTGYDATDVWTGLINTTSAVAKTFAKPTGLAAVTDAAYVDVLRAAILQVELGNSASLANKMGYNPTGILLNPADVANMELKKDSAGQYVIPPFASANGLTVKGVPVFPTIYMTAGSYLVGDFSAAKAWVKRSLQINMWDQNSTDPIYDLVTFTASHRLAFGVGAVKAYAFVTGTFADGIGLISA